MPINRFAEEPKKDVAVREDSGISLSFATSTYVRVDGESDMSGNLNMSLRKIENLADPVKPTDAVTKEYLDKAIGTSVIGEMEKGIASVKGDLDFERRYKILNLPSPTNEGDVVTRQYVDASDENIKTDLQKDQAFVFLNGEYQVKNSLNMRDGVIKRVGAPTNDGDATNRKFVVDHVEENTAFTFKRDVYFAKGNINLNRKKLRGLRDPTSEGEVATKRYVDAKAEQYVINENVVFDRDIGKRVFSLAEPKEDDEAATKKYVDLKAEQYFDQKGNINFDRNINVGKKRLFSLSDPKNPSEAATKSYVDELVKSLPKDPVTKEYVDTVVKDLASGNALVSKEGVFLKQNGHYRATASLDIDNNKVYNLPEPENDSDATTKKYVDELAKSLTLENALLKENGGYNVLGNAYINMNFNRIKNVADPVHTSDAVSKSFLDRTLVEEIELSRKRAQHVIAATASYRGNLVKDEYQFSFSGDQFAVGVNNGFLMPHSGYIKRFVMKIPGLKFDPSRSINAIDLLRDSGLLGTPIPLFTLVVLKEGENDATDLATLNIILNTTDPNDDVLKDEYTLVSHVAGGIEKYKLEAKNVLNIRSGFGAPTVASANPPIWDKEGVLATGFDTFTYLATILLELDPLA